MERRPTIKTIAELAGVSHVAVSRALRGCSDISPETTKRILAIAKEIGYTPNAAARSLSTHRTTAIGMIVPSLEENTAYNAIFNEISLAAAKHGYCVMLGSSHRSPELEQQHCQMMCENRVGALIIASCDSNIEPIKNICKGLIPIIFIGGKTDSSEPFALTCNYRHSAENVVAHLTALGHTDIALFTYAPYNNTILQKEDGFQTAMTKRGLNPRMYCEGHAKNTSQAGHDLTMRLIASHQLPTAIWCASDLMAMGVLSALRSQGLCVPQDISLIGHDDLFFGSLIGVDLTTCHTPMKELGAAAINLAIALIEGTPHIPNQSFDTSLTIRQTTGPLNPSVSSAIKDM